MTAYAEYLRTTDVGSLSLLFRSYCTPSGLGRFKLPNVEQIPQNRIRGDSVRSLLTKDEHTDASKPNEPQSVEGHGS